MTDRTRDMLETLRRFEERERARGHFDTADEYKRLALLVLQRHGESHGG